MPWAGRTPLSSLRAPPAAPRRGRDELPHPHAHTLTRLAPSRAAARQITHVVPTHAKEVDDVLGGEEAWRNVDATAGARRDTARSRPGRR